MNVRRCSAAHYRVPREVWWPASRNAPHFIPEIHVHLACAVPNALTLEIRAGRARPPERPGHGMRLSAETLGPYRTGAKEVQLR